MSLPPGVPGYRVNLGDSFPELAGIPVQNSAANPRLVSGLTLSVAHALTGHWFPGSGGQLSVPEFHAEIAKGCEVLRLDLERMFRWAGSIITPPTATLPPAALDAVPRQIWDTRDGWLTPHPYQLEKAAWSAHRLGSCSALSCGVGKTIVGVIAARAAGALGQCSRERLLIVCPCNAVGTWHRQVEELKKTYKTVALISSDNVHNLPYLDSQTGGALIVDEGHRFKNEGTRRADNMITLRTKFEWCILLTGTFTNTGLEGVIAMQDVACPGLSRVHNDLIFGDHFDATVTKKVGHTMRRKLTFTPDNRKADFARYLERSTYSLSLQSPEVAAVVYVPGQRKLDVDTWALPVWLRDTIEAEQKKAKERAAKANQEWDESDFWKTSPIAIPSLVPWNYYLGASTVAIMEEQREQLEEFAVKEGLIAAEHDPLTEDQLQEIHEQLKARRETLLYDPGVLKQRLDELKESLKWFGLPEFPRVLAASLRTGRIDRVVVQKLIRGKWSWAFQYAPGSSRKDPLPGHKIEYIRQWIKDNPKEPALLGAQGTLSVNMMCKMLDQEGKAYRIIRGGVNEKDRTEAENMFQKGAIDFMVVQQKAGSECITLTRAATSFLVDRDNSSLTYTQFLARTSRQSQTRECDHFDLIDNPIQAQQLSNLRRGNDFDAETRKLIEESVQYEKFLPH